MRKDPWTEKEDRIILKLIQRVGCRWATIAKAIPGRCVKASIKCDLHHLNLVVISFLHLHRTDFAIGNHYHQTLKRKLRIEQLKELKEGRHGESHSAQGDSHDRTRKPVQQGFSSSAENRVQVHCLLNPI